MKPEKKNTREPYEKPKIVIEKVELATVAGCYGEAQPLQFLCPLLGFCCD